MDYPLESFVFYRSFRDAIKYMSPEDQLVTLLAICDYALYGIEPDLDGMPYGIFTVAKPSIDANKVRMENGLKGGRPRKTEKPMVSESKNHRFSKAKSTYTDTVTVTDTEAVTGTDTKVGAPRFTPPTVDEVRSYCQERANGISAERFVDYYASNGWKVGKNAMKDWKAAVRNWETRDREKKCEGKPFVYDYGDTTGDLTEELRKRD